MKEEHEMDRRTGWMGFAAAVAVGLTTIALLAGCTGEGAGADSSGTAPTPTAEEERRPASALPVPGGEQPLPPGHPPTAGGGSLTWSLPEGWVEQQPASSMRIAQYAVPGPDGEGECVVYYFGPNQGGSPMANAQRWAGQFTQPDGRSSVDVMKVTRLEAARVPVQVVEVTGTYDGGMTMTAQPPQAMEGYMLLGGIAEGPDAPWFFKFTGPETTVLAQRDAFLALMGSIRVEGPS